MYRGVIIFPDFKLPNLKYSDPPDPLQGNPDQIIRLLNEFNFNWKTWQFRDLIDVKDRYSVAFMKYLSLPPGEQRLELVKQWHAALMSEEDTDINEPTDGDILFDWGMA